MLTWNNLDDSKGAAKQLSPVIKITDLKPIIT
jgi:hypothetical protein